MSRHAEEEAVHLLFNYEKIEDFYANLPIPIPAEHSRDRYSDHLVDCLNNVFLAPLAEAFAEHNPSNSIGPESQPSEKITFNKALVLNALETHLSKSNTNLGPITPNIPLGPESIELGELISEILASAGADVFTAGAGGGITASSKALPVIIEYGLELLASPAGAAFVTIAAIAIIAIFATSTHETLKDQMRKRQKEIDDEYEKAKTDRRKTREERDEARKKYEDTNDKIRRTREKLDDEKDKIDQIIIDCDEYFIGVVDRVKDTISASGEPCYEIQVDALKLKLLLVESTNQLYTKLLEGTSFFETLNELEQHSYMIKVYTDQYYPENAWCAFKCEEHSDQEAPPEGILGVTDDLSTGTAIIERFSTESDYQNICTYLVGDHLYGYVGQASKLKDPVEAMEETILKKVALKTLIEIFKRASIPGNDMKSIIRKLLESKLPTPLSNTIIPESHHSIDERITNTLNTALGDRTVQEIRLHNVGQASCASLLDKQANTMVYYDFGYGCGTHTREQANHINSNILGSLKESDVIILSHWDFDHYKLAISKNLETLKKRKRAPFPHQLIWIAPETKKQGPTLTRLKQSLQRLISWPNSGLENITVQNIKLVKAAGSARSPNNSGICLLLHADKKPWLLHPADASYFYIPRNPDFSGEITALVATHHASRRSILSPTGSRTGSTSSTDIPNPSTNASTPTVYYSYGQRSPYPNHNKAAVSPYYTAKGWEQGICTFDGDRPYIAIQNPARSSSSLFNNQIKALKHATAPHIQIRSRL